MVIKDANFQAGDFLQLILDNAPIAINAGTMEGKLLLWNKECETITGYSREEIEKIGVNAIFLDPNQRVAILKEIAKKGVVKGWEIAIRAKDGRIKTLLTSSALLRDDIGRPIGAISMGIDITEKKRLEEELEKRVDERTKELKRLKDYLENLFSTVHDAVVITDLKANVISANKTFQQLMGYTEDELRAQPPFALWHEEDKKHVQKYVREAMTKGFTRYRVRLITKSGQIRHFDATVSLIRNEKGEPIQALTIGKDITDVIRVEEELRARIDELERWQRLTVDRELKMIELKKRIRELEEQLGRERSQK